LLPLTVVTVIDTELPWVTPVIVAFRPEDDRETAELDFAQVTFLLVAFDGKMVADRLFDSPT